MRIDVLRGLCLGAAFGVALSMGPGCANIPLLHGSTQVVVAQGETTLDLAYNVAAKAYLAQLPTMAPATKAKVKPILVKAHQLVKAADQAEAVGNAAGLADQIGQATQLIAQAKSLLGAK